MFMEIHSEISFMWLVMVIRSHSTYHGYHARLIDLLMFIRIHSKYHWYRALFIAFTVTIIVNVEVSSVAWVSPGSGFRIGILVVGL